MSCTKRHQRSYPLTKLPIKLAVRLRNASYVVSTVRWSQRGGLLRRRHVPMGHQRSLRVFDGRIFSRELRYVYLGAHSRPWLSRVKLAVWEHSCTYSRLNHGNVLAFMPGDRMG